MLLFLLWVWRLVNVILKGEIWKKSSVTKEWKDIPCIWKQREWKSMQALLCLCFWFHSKAGWERLLHFTFCMDFCKWNSIRQAKYKCLHDWTQIDASIHEAYWRHAHQDKCLGVVQLTEIMLLKKFLMYLDLCKE